MCGCGKGKASSAQSYTVTRPDGSQKAFRSKVEAEAHAISSGGTLRKTS